MKQYIVDAFTENLFCGNQAAVCVLAEWPPDKVMQSITTENRFSETAFAVKTESGYHLRWFTPGGEIDFCGHATLATAYVLFRFYEQETPEIRFATQAGELTVYRRRKLYVMDFPAYRCNPVNVSDAMEAALGVRPIEAYLDRDLLLVLPSAWAVRELKPDLEKLRPLDGLLTIVTARSDTDAYDCVSRVFAPKLNVNEDPVTGSAHCMIAPYWCDKLHTDRLTCFQASARTGALQAQLTGNRVQIAGKAVLYSEGEILNDLVTIQSPD